MWSPATNPEPGELSVVAYVTTLRQIYSGNHMEQERETFEQLRQSFEELDDAACRRAAERMQAGERAQAAIAQESVMLQLVRCYN